MRKGADWAVWAFALGLLLIYAGSYYAFPALLPALEAETGWGKPALALGPTLGSLTMAVLTPLTGRIVDRGQARLMLRSLPAVAAGAMVVLALAPNPWVWWAGWVAIGAAQAGSVYETVFSLLTRLRGAEARAAITRITMLAGLSGTMTFPLGHWLSGVMGGQGAYYVFAALTALGTIPLYEFAIRRIGKEVPAAGHHTQAEGALRAALRRPAFWGIVAIFSMCWLDHGLLLTFILPLFHDRGASPAVAAFAAACLGPAQLAGRFVLMANGARITNRAATRWSIATVVLASVLIWVAGLAPWLIFAVVAAQGAGMGLMSIMRPMLLIEILGPRGFGAISGVAAVAPILASALAPSLGAAILTLAGPGGIYAALVFLSASSLALALILLKRPRMG